jgi:hypothetical protein
MRNMATEKSTKTNESQGTNWVKLEPVTVLFGRYLSWILPLATIGILLLSNWGSILVITALGANPDAIGYLVLFFIQVGIIVFILFFYVLKAFAPACAKKEWHSLTENAVKIADLRLPWMFIHGIILEIFGIGLAGVGLLFVAIILTFAGPETFTWIVKGQASAQVEGEAKPSAKELKKKAAEAEAAKAEAAKAEAAKAEAAKAEAAKAEAAKAKAEAAKAEAAKAKAEAAKAEAAKAKAEAAKAEAAKAEAAKAEAAKAEAAKAKAKAAEAEAAKVKAAAKPAATETEAKLAVADAKPATTPAKPAKKPAAKPAATETEAKPAVADAKPATTPAKPAKKPAAKPAAAATETEAKPAAADAKPAGKKKK